jgi:hypothetical protein
MHFSAIDDFFWRASFFINLAFLAVLIYRRRWPTFPILTTWIALLLLRTIVLFLIYRRSAMHGHSYSAWVLYNQIYVAGLWIDFLLQLGLIFEIARIVLGPTGTWARDARVQFAAAGLGGAFVAALVAWWISPPALTVRYAWLMRGDLFTSLVICELFVAVTFAANRLGLGWRNHVIAVSQGLTVWIGIMVVTTALQGFLGPRRHYMGLDHIRGSAHIAAIIWLTLQLWKDEPERRPISPDLQEYILALHRRVEYDLQRIGARR